MCFVDCLCFLVGLIFAKRNSCILRIVGSVLFVIVDSCIKLVVGCYVLLLIGYNGYHLLIVCVLLVDLIFTRRNSCVLRIVGLQLFIFVNSYFKLVVCYYALLFARCQRCVLLIVCLFWCIWYSQNATVVFCELLIINGSVWIIVCVIWWLWYSQVATVVFC